MLSVLLTYAFSFHLIIDPGHGGIDTGATYFGQQEASITLNIAKDLRSLLEADKDIQVSMTRHQDTKISLKGRATKAHNKQAQLFISIHTNSSPDTKAKGAEVYFENQLSADDEALFLAHREQQLELGGHISGRPSLFKGKYNSDLSSILDDLAKNQFQQQSYLFAQKIGKQWKTKMKREIRLKQAPFYVISHTNMPSVLVEVGFLSNRYEATKLMKRSYQKKIAQILHKAVLDWKEEWTFYRSQL